MSKLIVCISLALVACTHATMVALPGFGRVDGPYDFRAASPLGIVIAAHAERNEPRADLSFWAAAIDVSLLRKGYARTGAIDVKSAGGIPGRLMKYDVGDGGAYWVAVFAGHDRVLVSQATGDKDDLEASANEIESSLLSARVR
jgi:hypothetical protein